MTMKVLITGFEPFGNEKVNPSWLAVKGLPDKLYGAEIIKVQLPVVFYEANKQLGEMIRRQTPDIIIGVGQAGGRSAIAIERVAINCDDARIPDNNGNQPIDLDVVPGGPSAYFSSLPIKAISHKIRAFGIPCSVSNSAGTYVCNHLMYGICHIIATEYPAARGGFIHVPYIPEQVVENPSQPSMSLECIIKAIEVAIITSIETKDDIKKSEGQTH